MFRQSLSLVTAIFALTMCSQLQASIILGTTRVIFEGHNKEASVTVQNLGNSELLVQSWLDAGSDALTSVPFAVTPPLAHMAGKSRQVLRVLFQGTGVLKDKESVYWLNVQEIPEASDKENVLQLAVRQRIKLFYRPAGLKGDVASAPAELKRQVLPNGKKTILRISNPTNYHVSMVDLKVEGDQYTSAPINSFMVAPGADHDVLIDPLPSSNPLTLTLYSINDYGGKDLYRATLAHKTFQLIEVKPK